MADPQLATVDHLIKYWEQEAKKHKQLVLHSENFLSQLHDLRRRLIGLMPQPPVTTDEREIHGRQVSELEAEIMRLRGLLIERQIEF